MNASLFAGGTVVGEDNVVRFGYLRFWAERGLIHIEDETDNSYECISVHSALERMNAISDMLASSPRTMYTEDQFDQANRRRHQDMLDGLTALCNKAKIQGMPTDRTARRALKRSRPLTLTVPSNYGIKAQL